MSRNSERPPPHPLTADQAASAAAAAGQEPGIRPPSATVTSSSSAGRDLLGWAGGSSAEILRMPGFSPHDRLLALIGVAVTNFGGSGALAPGVPLVAQSRSWDKPEVSRWAARPGIGVGLRTGAPKHACVARPESEVTARPAVRTGARELGAAPTSIRVAHTAAHVLTVPWGR